MNQSVLNILDIVFATTCSQISFLVKVALQIAVNCHRQSIAPDVKLSVLVKKGPFTVLLDDVRSFLAIYMCVAYDLFDLTKFSTNCYSTASISVFTGLNNPQLLAHSWIFCQIRMISR